MEDISKYDFVSLFKKETVPGEFVPRRDGKGQVPKKVIKGTGSILVVPSERISDYLDLIRSNIHDSDRMEAFEKKAYRLLQHATKIATRMYTLKPEVRMDNLTFWIKWWTNERPSKPRTKTDTDRLVELQMDTRIPQEIVLQSIPVMRKSVVEAIEFLENWLLSNT